MHVKLSNTFAILSLWTSCLRVASVESSGIFERSKEEDSMGYTYGTHTFVKESPPDAQKDEHQYIVKYVKDSAVFSSRLKNARRKLSDSGKDVPNFIPVENVEILYLESEEDVKLLENMDQVEYVEKDTKVYPHQEIIPYGISAVKAFDVSDSFVGNRKVCIIDSGYDINHPDLPDGSKVTGRQLGAGPWNQDGYGHGTHVAGTIAAIGSNGRGVVGTVRNGELKLHIVRIFDNAGEWAWTSTLVNAVNECVASGANIVNMSLGGPSSSLLESQAYSRIYNEGVLIVASAGNLGDSSYGFPASYSSVMSVSAVDSGNKHASFSQRNDQVEISAPGVSIVSTFPGNSYKAYTGTSMAAPHVSGVAALIWSHFPSKTPQEVRQALTDSVLDLGDSGWDNMYGFGLLQADQAMKYLSGEITPAPTQSPTKSPSKSPSNGTPGECIDSPIGWHDEDGPNSNCEWYGQGNNCAAYGDECFGVDDKSAKQACCACGGGYTYPLNPPTKVPTPTTKPPTTSPTTSSSKAPTKIPTKVPTNLPTATSTTEPSYSPSNSPSSVPSTAPSSAPSSSPSNAPSSAPSIAPTNTPTAFPTPDPSNVPTNETSSFPSKAPTSLPTATPTSEPSGIPSNAPSSDPSTAPTSEPTSFPSNTPSSVPSTGPTNTPTRTAPIQVRPLTTVSSGFSARPHNLFMILGISLCVLLSILLG